MSDCPLRPLAGKIVVEQILENTRVGDLYLPDSAAGKSQEARVLAVGEPREGNPLPIKVGDRVILAQWGGVEVKIGGKSYRIASEEDVLGVVE